MKPKNSKLEIWGLTGGIASGKSTVAALFEKAGIPCLDADHVARELSGPGGAAHGLIISKFGTADRARLRELVFSDPSARKDLEALLHPLIAKASDHRLSELAKQYPGKPLIYEAALLVETGRYRDFSGLIVVDAPREIRVKRVQARDQCSAEQAQRILNAQSSDEARLKAATVVIPNPGSLRDLESRVSEFLKLQDWLT